MNAEAIIAKHNLQEKQWTYKGFHGVLHTFFPLGEMMLKPFKEAYGDSFSFTVYYIQEDYVHWFWNDEEMTRLRIGLIQKVSADPLFLQNFCS